jgi:uncharacterized membrane protein
MKTTIALAAALGLASTSYALQITDLGAMGEQYSSATAINDSGVVVGQASSGDTRRSFVYDPVNSTRPVQSELVEPAGVNNSGLIIGTLGLRPAVFTPSVNTTSFVGDFLAGTATAINNLGQVAGYFYKNPRGEGDPQAFIYDRGHGLTALSCSPDGNGCYSVATAINEFGQVVGWSNRGAFIYSGGAMQSFGGASAVARSINNHGDVVGEYWNGTVYRAFIYSQAVFTELKDDHSQYSRATDINDNGQVVGFLQLPPDRSCQSCNDYWQAHAFLYSNGTLTDLNTLFPGQEWQIQYAEAINNHGQIVGKGLHRGQDRAFLITLD